jgi:hypothetical protein
MVATPCQREVRQGDAPLAPEMAQEAGLLHRGRSANTSKISTNFCCSELTFAPLHAIMMVVNRQELKYQYGQEVILLCSCSAHRSHLMDGREPRCPRCGDRTKFLLGDSYEEIESYHGLKR